jgi:nucleoside-diphosphate-sugar epimerase
MLIAVTGANGFIGRALCRHLLSQGYAVRGVVRESTAAFLPGAGKALEVMAVAAIDSTTEWADVLAGADCVIHCAARAHVLTETSEAPLAAYRAVNVAGTLQLATVASAIGVRRLIFLSSIGVLGVDTNGRPAFSCADKAAPVEDYAVSKWEAEQALAAVSTETGLEVVTVRSPLVYGPDAKGNIARLLGLVRRGIPLPLAAVSNRRSLVGLDNLVDMLVCCIDHPRAASQTFLISDDEDLSTPELLRRMAAALGRPARLFPIPTSWLRLTARVLGRRGEIDRLVGSLLVDSSATREILNWTPPVSVDEGLRRMVTQG